MTQIQKVVALGVAVAGVALGSSAFAQDDLEDLLKELENETSSLKAPPAEEPAAPTAEAPTAEEPAAEAPAVEEPAAPAAEEPAAPTAEASATEEPSAPAVEEPSVPAPAAPVAATADDELIANLAKTEEIRRNALDAQAKREIKTARKCLEDGEYDEAVRHYDLAEKLLKGRSTLQEFTKECEEGMANGFYLGALQDDKLGLRAEAIKKMEMAMSKRHPRARRILEKWNAEGTTVKEDVDLTNIAHRKNEEAYKQMREKIRYHLRRSRQLGSLREIDKALEECDDVLNKDPYNEEAIRIRAAIEKKRQVILLKERGASRDGMIADVDRAWRPAYGQSAKQLTGNMAETIKSNVGDDPERSREQDIERRMKEMRLPSISFKPPATIIEAIDYFRTASRDFDRPEIPAEKRGFNFVLRTPQGALKSVSTEEADAGFESSEDSSATTNGLDPIPTITASDITFYEALKLVCDSVGYKFLIQGQVVMVMPQDMTIGELISRKYNVPDAFVERVNNASEEMRTMSNFGASTSRKPAANEEEGEGRDWEAFFEKMGVKWPEGAKINHIKALGKLYVRNTRENLAEFEKILDELGAQTPLIEVETRFVEVSQEDLNSLGFEWLMNSDYNLGLGEKLGRSLGIGEGAFQNVTSGGTTSDETTTLYTYNSDGTVSSVSTSYTPAGTGSSTSSKWLEGGDIRNLGIAKIAGQQDFSKVETFGNGTRFMSTMGNTIAGESKAYNDQFMKVNAFLGNADLSLILHMLSQRSDTDLLSAPKIVTKSGENAVIKVVTEYIYPQDYDVQLQSSSSGGSGNYGGGSQSAVLAVVEPQNFTMREVGVILDVTPTYSEANGGTIDLEMKPQVVDEPTWKNYGMKIPFTGNSSLQNFEGIGGIFDGLAASITAIGAIPQATKDWIIKSETEAAQNALGNLTKSTSDNMTYYEAPMEQPWFHVRSIDSKVAITPGSTVVMGGLITEQRKAMDDKVPFLGDLPFIGRLFRSHAEKTVKRNLLIFVTARLITPSGRELRVNDADEDETEVKAAPSAE